MAGLAEVNIPIGLFNWGVPSRPMNEGEVEYGPKVERHEKQPKLPVAPAIARPTPPLLVFDGRGFQSVNPPAATAEHDMRAYGIGNGTGKGYDGPFVLPVAESEEQPSPPKERDGLMNMQVIPGGTPDSTNETFLSKAIRPYEDELEAARNGMRWHWALQNRMMLPGSKWNETVWNGVDRENQYLAILARAQKAQAGNLKDITQPVASAREKANMLNMWKTFLTDIKNGNFDAYGGTTETVQKWADDFKKHFEEKFGEGASVELAPLPDVLGKRSELARKSLIDLRTNLDDTEFAVKQLGDWLDKGDFDSEEGRSRISRILDKVGQSFTARLGGDSKSMADAEKVRIQIQYLPPAAKAQVYDTINAYRDALTAIAASSSDKEWTQNNWGKINEIADSDVDDDKTAVSVLTAIGDLVTQRGLDGVLMLPHDVATALQTNKELFENYMSSMVLAANVAPQVVYDFAKYLHDQSANSYNDLAKQFGRIERANELPPLDPARLANIMPADPLMKTPKFVGPKLEKRPKGDTSSNPQTDKEGNMVVVTDEEGGII